MEIILSEVSLEEIFPEEEEVYVRSGFEYDSWLVEPEVSQLVGFLETKKDKPESMNTAVLNANHSPFEFCQRYYPSQFQSGYKTYEDDAPLMESDEYTFFNKDMTPINEFMTF